MSKKKLFKGFLILNSLKKLKNQLLLYHLCFSLIFEPLHCTFQRTFLYIFTELPTIEFLKIFTGRSCWAFLILNSLKKRKCTSLSIHWRMYRLVDVQLRCICGSGKVDPGSNMGPSNKRLSCYPLIQRGIHSGA